MFFSSESVRRESSFADAFRGSYLRQRTSIVVVTMRAWAIWGCSYRVTVRFFSLYTLYLVTVFGVACYFWRRSGGM